MDICWNNFKTSEKLVLILEFIMQTGQQIIKTIRNMYRRKEPLNITAVKRYHPELMKAVYAIRPFWGWKKALEAAGIKYSDIEVELLDYCECEICHARKKILSFHVLQKHGVEMDDYRIDYPESDVICEEIRARRAKMKCREMPHWEPLWTVEYALDRLWARYEKGMPINCYAIFLNEPSLTLTLQRRFRFRDTALSLHDMVLKEKLGLKPEDIRRKPRSLKNKEEVLNVIIKRWNRNLPLNSTDLNKGKNRIQALRRGATRMFGSWKKAIKTAGLDYNLINKNPLKYPTPEKLLHEILRRRKAGLPLNAKALSRRGKNGDEALYRMGREYFGLWKKALKAAGIRYKNVVKVSGPQQKYPTAEAVIAEIQRRQKEKISIRRSDIIAGSHSDGSLYAGAMRHIGNWAKALKRARFSCQVPLK